MSVVCLGLQLVQAKKVLRKLRRGPPSCFTTTGANRQAGSESTAQGLTASMAFSKIQWHPASCNSIQRDIVISYSIKEASWHSAWSQSVQHPWHP
eukprot:1053493-Pelagomonas_calceolata.AAC.3